MQNAAIITGGGMRNVFTSGVILGAKLLPEKFSRIYAFSSGAPLSAYFIAKQFELTEHVWVDRLMDKAVFMLRRLLSWQFPLDIDYIVDECNKDIDIDNIVKSHTELIVSVFRRADGETIYLKLTRENYKNLLKATCALPFLARPVLLDDGNYYVDGGVFEILPVKRAYMDGFRKLVVFLNVPLTHQERYGYITSRLAFPWYRRARRLLRRQHLNGNESLSFIQKHKPDDLEICLVAPTHELPVKRFERSPEVMRKTFEIGFEYGIRIKEHIHKFLQD